MVDQYSDIIKNNNMTQFEIDIPSQNFDRSWINHSIGQLTKNRTANIFARQLAHDGSVIKRALLLSYTYIDALRICIRVRRWRELAKDKG